MFSVFSRARKSLSRALSAVTGAFAIAGLAACVPSGSPTAGGGLPPGAPVQVALLVPSGSGDASVDMVAQHLQNAARLAISDLGSNRIDLRIYPTGGDAARAQSQAVKAVDDGAKIILGPLYAHEANAAGLAAASRGVSVLAFSNNPDIAGGNVFILGQTFRNTADRLAAFAVRQGKPRAMILHGNSLAGNAGRAAFEGALARAGGQLAGSRSYDVSQNGITSAMPGILAALRDTAAQTVFLTADNDKDLPLVTQFLRDGGISPPSTAIAGITRWDIPAQALTLPGLQGGWFATPDPGLYAQYQRRFQAAYGQPPHPVSSLAYDGIAAVGALIKRGGQGPLSAAALTQSSGFAGVNGIFRLRPDGTSERGLAVAGIQNGQITILDPAPRSFGGAGF